MTCSDDTQAAGAAVGRKVAMLAGAVLVPIGCVQVGALDNQSPVELGFACKITFSKETENATDK